MKKCLRLVAHCVSWGAGGKASRLPSNIMIFTHKNNLQDEDVRHVSLQYSAAKRNDTKHFLYPSRWLELEAAMDVMPEPHTFARNAQ